MITAKEWDQEVNRNSYIPFLLCEFITLCITFITKKLVLNCHLTESINSEQMQFLKQAE